MAATSRNTVVPAENLNKAADLYEDCFGDIYALDDIGRRFAGNPFTVMTMAHAVKALTKAIKQRLSEADALIPGTRVHPALIASAGATDALNDLDEFMLMASGDDGTITFREQTAGMAIYDLTVRAGQEIDRARIACGFAPCSRYLDGDGHDPARPPLEQQSPRG